MKALYDSNESSFAFTNFNTDFSDDMCSITLKLSDEAGDGWNGAAIQVVDVLTGIVIGTYTNEDLDGEKYYEINTYYVPVPNDRDINFVWEKGRFDNECSFVIYDVNGKEIYRFNQNVNSQGPSAGLLHTYNVDCRYTPNPSDLTVTPAPTTATVTWTGVADSYDVHYAPFPTTGLGAGWLQYDDGAKWGDLGSYPASTWTWGVMYPAVTGNRLTKVSFYQNTDFSKENITISIYAGDNPPSGTPLRTVEVRPLDSADFHKVTFDTPVEITPKENIWIVLKAIGTYILSYCKNNEPNNQWIYYNGIWQHLGDLEIENRGWMIRGYFESTTDSESVRWTKDTSTSSSYTITGLTPETDYYVQVRGDYGCDGKSEWVTSLFTTPADNTSAISLPAPDSISKGEESIYSLDGVKFDKVPTRKGVYIQNGRKVVIK